MKGPSVVIIGSGPSGFYAAESISKKLNSDIDILDRLPTPFGLIRGGVAPDHQTTKKISVAYTKIAKKEQINFFGNIEIGKDISIEELRKIYDVVVIAIGSEIDNKLQINGSDIKGVYGSATEKPLNDIKWTQAQIDDSSLVGPAPAGADTNTVRIMGLKGIYKDFFNKEAARLLEKTDWYVIKATDVESYSVPSNIKTYRAAVRTKVNEMETAIDNCADVAALETLLSYKTGTRPLGEFPVEVV